MGCDAKQIFNNWLMPLLAVTISLFALSKRVKVYDSLVEGAREGFQIVIMIIPFLVAILVAVGVFRASGALDVVLAAVEPVTSLIGFPPEALPMAIIRPLSGQGALGVLTETMQTYGPDSFIGYLSSVLGWEHRDDLLRARPLLREHPAQSHPTRGVRVPRRGHWRRARRAVLVPGILLRRGSGSGETLELARAGKSVQRQSRPSQGIRVSRSRS